MNQFLGSWQLWACLSAAFAALTAIFAKIGIENVNSDFATFIRTIVILGALAAFLAATSQWQRFEFNFRPQLFVLGSIRPCDWRFLGLLFSRIEIRECVPSCADR